MFVFENLSRDYYWVANSPVAGHSFAISEIEVILRALPGVIYKFSLL